MKAVAMAMLVSALVSAGEEPVAAPAGVVFNSNYDLAFRVADTESRIRSRARVRSGHSIPVEMPTHRVDLRISELPSERYAVAISIFERSRGDWYRIDAGEVGFDGQLGVPAQFSWESGDLWLNIAIVIGRME